MKPLGLGDATVTLLYPVCLSGKIEVAVEVSLRKTWWVTLYLSGVLLVKSSTSTQDIQDQDIQDQETQDQDIHGRKQQDLGRNITLILVTDNLCLPAFLVHVREYLWQRAHELNDSLNQSFIISLFWLKHVYLTCITIGINEVKIHNFNLWLLTHLPWKENLGSPATWVIIRHFQFQY